MEGECRGKYFSRCPDFTHSFLYRQGCWLLFLTSEFWLFVPNSKDNITKSVPPHQWREPGGDAEELQWQCTSRTSWLLTPSVSEQVKAGEPVRIGAGHGEALGGQIGLSGMSGPPWHILMLHILVFLPGCVEGSGTEDLGMLSLPSKAESSSKIEAVWATWS